MIGGDLSKSNNIIISSNFFGYVTKGKILNRTGARINDDIWITGNLGESSIGLAIRQKKIKLNEIAQKYFVTKYLFPKHCFIGNKINNLATAAIDISDGLNTDLNRILAASNVGAQVHIDLLPLSTELIAYCGIIDNARQAAITGGDDYCEGLYNYTGTSNSHCQCN